MMFKTGPALMCVLPVLIGALLVHQRCVGADQLFVGAWESSSTDAVGKRSRMVWEFREDGTYTYHSHDGHSGSYTAEGDALNISAQERAWPHITPAQLQFSYALNSQGSLELQQKPGAHPFPLFPGTQTWTRVKDNVYFMTEKVGTQYVPKYLSVIVARILFTVANPWRDDAIPVALTIESLPYQTFYLRLEFVSPSDGAGLGVDVHQFEQKVTKHSHVTWGSHAIPAFFLDLPDTLRLARQRGITGQLTQAMLKRWERGHQAWTLNVSGKGLVLEATTGEPITEELTNYVANYNEQWEEAAANLRQLFQPNNPEDQISCDALFAAQQYTKCYYEWQEEVRKEAEADCIRRGGSWRFASCY